MNARWMVGLGLAAALPLVGCGPAGEIDITSRWVGKPAPDFTLTSLDGREYSLSQLRGKVVLLSFWAVY